MSNAIFNSMSLRAKRSNLCEPFRLLRFARNDGNVSRALLAIVLCLTFCVNVFAAEPAKKEQPFHMVTLEGTIEGKTRANISLQYKQEGNQLFEAVLPVNSETKLKGYKKYQDIAHGDVVRVEFKEPYQIDDKGKEVRTGREVKQIQFLKHSMAGKLISLDDQ